MASRYLKATGNWSSTATWSSTSGGVAGASTPTQSDDVIIDANSNGKTLTIDTAVACQSFVVSGSSTAIITGSPSYSLSVGNGSTGGTFTLLATSSFSNQIPVLWYCSGGTWTMTTAGQTLYSLAVGSGSSGANVYRLGGALTVTNSLTVTVGTLNANGYAIQCGSFATVNNGWAKTLTLGSTTMTVNGTGAAWTVTDLAHFTLGMSGGTIACSGAGITFAGGGCTTYGTVTFTGANQITVSGANTFVTLTRTGTAAMSDTIAFQANQTIGTFNANGNSAINRLLVWASPVGTAATLTVTTLSTSYADWQDITSAGGASWDIQACTGNSGDCGGNTGITCTSPSAQHWNGTAGGTWSTNAWSTHVPLPQDTAYLDAAYSGAPTITVDMPRLPGLDTSSASAAFTLALGLAVSIYGGYNCGPQETITGAFAVTFAGRGANTIGGGSPSFPAAVSISCYAGSLTVSGFSALGNLNIVAGTFIVSDGAGLLVLAFLATGSGTRTITMGASTTFLSATAGTVLDLTGTNIAFSGASAAFWQQSTPSATITFAGGGRSYGLYKYTGSSAFALIITGANTFGTLDIESTSAARSVTIPSSVTQTVTGTLTLKGAAGKLLSLLASGTGVAGTISISSAVTVTCDYLSLKDQIGAGTGANIPATHSSVVSNVTGWLLGRKASATLSATGTLTPTATAKNQVSASLSAAGTLTPAATRKVLPSASLSGVGTLTSTAIATYKASVALSGSGSLSTSPAAIIQATATLSAIGTLSATGILRAEDASTLVAAGTLTAVALALEHGTAALSGAGTLSAVATVISGTPEGSAALSGTGTLSATATLKQRASAALSAAGTLGATAHSSYPTATLVAAGSLAVTATVVAEAHSALSASATLTAAATVITGAAATLAAAGTLTAVAHSRYQASAALSATASLTAAPVDKRQAAVALTGTGTLAAASVLEVEAAVALRASGTLLAAGGLLVQASAPLSASGALAAVAHAITQSAASLDATGVLDAQATRVVLAVVFVDANGDLAAVPNPGELRRAYVVVVLTVAAHTQTLTLAAASQTLALAADTQTLALAATTAIGERLVL